MKKIYLFVLVTALMSCDLPDNAYFTYKKMPQNELAFIKKVTAIDSVFKAQTNEITKEEALEKGKKDVADYILKNLNVENWVVIINGIEVNSYPTNYIKVSAFIPIGNWRKEKYPGVSFPVLVALLKTNQSKIKDQLKTLEKMDEVYISGHLIKNSSGGINVLPSVIDGDTQFTFSNLALNLDITEIRKTH